jgi:hypothetical protein
MLYIWDNEAIFFHILSYLSLEMDWPGDQERVPYPAGWFRRCPMVASGWSRPDITWIYPEIDYSGEDKELADDQDRLEDPAGWSRPVPVGCSRMNLAWYLGDPSEKRLPWKRWRVGQWSGPAWRSCRMIPTGAVGSAGRVLAGYHLDLSGNKLLRRR